MFGIRLTEIRFGVVKSEQVESLPLTLRGDDRHVRESPLASTRIVL